MDYSSRNVYCSRVPIPPSRMCNGPGNIDSSCWNVVHKYTRFTGPCLIRQFTQKIYKRHTDINAREQIPTWFILSAFHDTFTSLIEKLLVCIGVKSSLWCNQLVSPHYHKLFNKVLTGWKWNSVVNHSLWELQYICTELEFYFAHCMRGVHYNSRDIVNGIY